MFHVAVGKWKGLWRAQGNGNRDVGRGWAGYYMTFLGKYLLEQIIRYERMEAHSIMHWIKDCRIENLIQHIGSETI